MAATPSDARIDPTAKATYLDSSTWACRASTPQGLKMSSCMKKTDLLASGLLTPEERDWLRRVATSPSLSSQ
eukprot:1262332-Prymnesium_polylepis.1